MASSRTRGRLDWTLGKTSSLKSGRAAEPAAQGSGGVTIPGGVQKTCGRGTSGHG